MSPVASETARAILVVLLHHGGSVGAVPLAFIMTEVGVTQAVYREALVGGDALGFWDALGDRLLMCRAGWAHLAAQAPSLESLSGRK